MKFDSLPRFADEAEDTYFPCSVVGTRDVLPCFVVGTRDTYLPCCRGYERRISVLCRGDETRTCRTVVGTRETYLPCSVVGTKDTRTCHARTPAHLTGLVFLMTLVRISRQQLFLIIQVSRLV